MQSRYGAHPLWESPIILLITTYMLQTQGRCTVSVVSGSTDSVITTILVGELPYSIAHASPNNKIYVTNAGSNDVYVINGATNKVIKNIPVGNAPAGIAFNPSNNNVYVVNSGDDTISVIDTSTDSVINTISLESELSPPTFAAFLAYDSMNGAMYVGARNQVFVINTVTNADVKDIPMPLTIPDSQATDLVHNPNDNHIYVTAGDSDAVVKINPDTHNFEDSPIPVGVGPIGIIHNPNNNLIYVTNSGSNTVYVINPTTSSVVGMIPTGSTPAGITYNPINNHVYVANAGSNQVSLSSSIRDFHTKPGRY